MSTVLLISLMDFCQFHYSRIVSNINKRLAIDSLTMDCARCTMEWDGEKSEQFRDLLNKQW